jgi:hypothetical protein
MAASSDPAVRAVNLEIGFGRLVLAPLLPLALLAAGVAARLNRGAVVLLFLLLLVVVGVTVRWLLEPPVLVQGGRLSIRGREGKRRAPGGSVDLTRLATVKSVSYRGGLVSGRGLALFRTYLHLVDTDGGEAMFIAWGWSPKAPLRAALRQAISATHAKMDPMTWWRLGFRNDQGARISVLRRFI